MIRQDLELSERKCPRRSQARVVSGGHAPREVAEAWFGANRGLRQPQLEQDVWRNVRRWWFCEGAPQISSGLCWGSSPKRGASGGPECLDGGSVRGRIGEREMEGDLFGGGPAVVEQHRRSRMQGGSLVRPEVGLDGGPHDGVGEGEARPR